MAGKTNDELDDDEVLAFTQRTRRNLVDRLTDEGRNIPTDKDGAGVLLAALGDMDKVAMGKKRLKADQNLGDATKQAAAIIAAVFDQTAGKANPFKTQQPTNEVVVPKHPDVLTDIELVPGELDQGNHDLNYNDFMSGKSDEKT